MQRQTKTGEGQNMRGEGKKTAREERERERDAIENNAFHISSINKLL